MQARETKLTKEDLIEIREAIEAKHKGKKVLTKDELQKKQDIVVQQIKELESNNETEILRYNQLQQEHIGISLHIHEHNLYDSLEIALKIKVPSEHDYSTIIALQHEIKTLEIRHTEKEKAIKFKKRTTTIIAAENRADKKVLEDTATQVKPVVDNQQAASPSKATTPDQQKTQTQPISKTQKIPTYIVITLVFGLIIFSATQIGLLQTMLFVNPIAAIISFGLVTNEIINQVNYSNLKKSALVSSYLIAHIAACVLFMNIYAYAVPILVLSALIAIAAQLYYKENTPSHFRQFCLNMSILFFISTLDPINILALLSSSKWAYIYYACMIIDVILSYDYLIANSSTGEYFDGAVGSSNIAMPIITDSILYVFFFLGLISRSDDFKDALKNIKWKNLILGVIIGAVTLWVAAILIELAAGSIFVACIGALPNAFSIVSVLILTPFQAYYEEYFFRHKLTEKIQSIYALFITHIWNKYLWQEYAAEPKLATNSYLVYSITSVFFALVHITAPDRNFSVIQSLLTTLPIGILLHKIYSDYGIEASTGVHTGNNALICLNMLPIFIETTAFMAPIPMDLFVLISCFAQGLITVALSKAFLAKTVLESASEDKPAPTESSAFSNMCKQVQGYCNSAKSTLSSYAKPILGCL